MYNRFSFERNRPSWNSVKAFRGESIVIFKRCWDRRVHKRMHIVRYTRKTPYTYFPHIAVALILRFTGSKRFFRQPYFVNFSIIRIFFTNLSHATTTIFFPSFLLIRNARSSTKTINSNYNRTVTQRWYNADRLPRILLRNTLTREK